MAHRLVTFTRELASSAASKGSILVVVGLRGLAFARTPFEGGLLDGVAGEKISAEPLPFMPLLDDASPVAD